MSPSSLHADAQALTELAWQVGQAAVHSGVMLVTAESCTGGLIAQLLTERGGSSAWFERGFVTYSNQAKMQSLGVPADVLRDHGAVSEPVALAMAKGALRHSLAGFAMAVTGIAGPGGGTDHKPVGTVCMAWAGGDRAQAQTHWFSGDRAAVRVQTAHICLHTALEWLMAKGPRSSG